MSALGAEKPDAQYTEGAAAPFQPEKHSDFSTLTATPIQSRGRSHNTDEQLAVEYGLPATAAAITEMALADLHSLLYRHGMSEFQKHIALDIRLRGKEHAFRLRREKQRANKTPDLIFGCDQCHRCFATPSGLQSHTAAVHGAQLSKRMKRLREMLMFARICPICKSSFQAQWTFMKHLAVAHSDFSGDVPSLVEVPEDEEGKAHPYATVLIASHELFALGAQQRKRKMEKIEQPCLRGIRSFCDAKACERCSKLRIFGCDQCERRVTTLEGLRVHMNLMHDGVSKRMWRLHEMLEVEKTCPICSSSFNCFNFTTHLATAHSDFAGNVLSLVKDVADEPPSLHDCNIADPPEEPETKQDVDGNQIISEVYGPAERPRDAAEAMKEEVDEIGNMEMSGGGVEDVKEEYGEELLAVREEESVGNDCTREVKEEVEDE